MRNNKTPFLSAIFTASIRGYQRFFSAFTPSSCRFYPTCSNYALWLLCFESPLSAMGKIAIRILSCNPFCSGGIAYPITRLKRPSLLQSHKDSNRNSKTITFWLVPTTKSHATYYIIKV
ncbi:membrane protein insertion efficiency factor YidD [Helicobacter pylori]|uniref:membrane protein insertion efficiency factor YidD n=1 Tax=Helicobacter pylori TaxID=210 RepID=UPI000BEB5961|nr:membrane protein insertion efficiency factor YidD [Helicobacter pylori]MBS3010206.1 membrane protein insertion efficiency factor YidD [Helicobacter pylori]MBS3016347.1 membrane protein insertion efficiency factor YidD [Helicobacter pylori]PDW41591.1 membrane protein insertion efficiency factor YidD [Helicobacter pylori]